MYYILELFNRFKYLLISYFFLLGCLYFKYDVFFAGFDFIFKNIFNKQNQQTINYYIYTHPFELYFTQLYFCFFTSLYFIFPYFCWQFLDYKKTSLYQNEFKFIINFFYKIILIFPFSFILFYSQIIPLFLNFLAITKEVYTSSIFTVYFELKVQDFIQFVLYFNTIFIICLLFLIILSFLVFNISLKKILKHKKSFYLITIIFSTFISPPDIFSQVFLILLLSSTIEFIILIRLFKYLIKFKVMN